ncbi:flagellar assembly peptidoglycan hydrolase FlgJ [Roseateles toxinivorans]|uniref:Peptidoglycan hydrolase FlgJ n=1 Tax=Roseateles toxinivorans TaxID=270368 RepID=A0A4R6QMD4_9BURK|nr:flagellar assembly peptidoglycan hydrolase FlgJ [Roseateles toxinivorans]TDP71649.1 flagellar protein FlgJ [Roseateles toxinivorans]
MAGSPFISATSTVGMANQGLASDGRSINGLRAAAARDPKAAIKETAKQFETLFMQEVMKSMRASTMSTGMLDNSATQLGTEMLDTQYSSKLSGMRGGLADAIAKHLERQLGQMDGGSKPPTAKAASAALPALAQKNVPTKVSQFIQQHDSAAKAVAAQTGIPASFMIAQAAHESGWGKREITHKDGTSANNLFGIKAGANWKGPVAEVQTTEYIDGKPQKVMAKFRAYASTEEGFRDYANLLTGNERYKNVVANAATPESFARGLQKAGYATDPAYADKLTKVINTTLRLQRQMVA